jgi:DNA-binding GntR family transcriptional regulator
MLDLLERGDNLEAAHFMRRHLSGALAVKSPVVPKAEFTQAPKRYGATKGRRVFG